MTSMPKFSLSLLESTIPTIFDQVQTSSANHRKNAVALHKLQVYSAAVTTSVKGNSAVHLTGEKAFGNALIDMINRILVIRKGVVVADRVARFVGTFIKYMTEKVSESRPAEDEDNDDTPESRLVARIVAWLLQGFEAKDKNIRYRCVQIIGEMISYVGELDESIYLNVRQSLMDRVSDKESLLRSNAIIGLSKLYGSEDPSELLPGGLSISQVLLYTMCYDPSAEVRRTALLHTPVTPETLHAILSRSRDVDALTRKILYSTVLSTKVVHPRALSISQREQLVKDGLGDREDAVRVAAGKMVSSWYEIITAKDGSVIDFLELFDVVGPQGDIAVDALLSVFVTLPDTLYTVNFDEKFWSELSPESALLARVFVEHTFNSLDQSRLELSSLPVVTEFAFHIQEIYNHMMELFQQSEDLVLACGRENEDDEQRDSREDKILNGAFILSEILKIAVKLDYADEIGRRKMFRIVRDMVAHRLLPEDLVDPAIDVLKELLPSERELAQVVVEIVIDLRDPDGDTNDLEHNSSAEITQGSMKRERSLKRTVPEEELSEEAKAIANVTDLRCLTLCISMLAHINSSFEDNSVLEGIVTDVILPAVKRREFLMRQKGLLGLGFCCLLSENMASPSLRLFLSQVQSSPETLKLQLLQIIFDIFLVHRNLAKFAVDGGIFDFLLPTFENETSEEVQAVICTGLAKMMLFGLINDDRVLTSLVFAYVSPATADNQELRQCLAYFLPVYCYSAPVNQLRMASIFLPAYYRVYDVYDQLEDGDDMITPTQFGALFIDWTNPQKVAKVNDSPQTRDSHVELAVDILRGLYDEDRPDDSKTILCQLIGKINLPTMVEPHSLLRLNLLITHVQERCTIQDKAALKIFDRFKARFLKQFSEPLVQIDEDGYDVDYELQDLYEYVGIDPPDMDANTEGRKQTSRQRQSSTPIIPSTVHKQSIESHEEQDEDEELSGSDTDGSVARSMSPKPARKGIKHGKMPRENPAGLSTAASVSSEQDSKQNISATSRASVMPKRAVKRLRSPGKNENGTSPVRKRRLRESSDALDTFRHKSDIKKTLANLDSAMDLQWLCNEPYAIS